MKTPVRPVAIVAGIPEELAGLRRILAGGRTLAFCAHRGWSGRLAGRDVVVAVAGDGAARADRILAELLDAVPCSALVGIGVAGGLTSDLAAGDLVTAAVVRAPGGASTAPDPILLRAAVAAGAAPVTAVTSSGVVATPAAKQALAASLPGTSAVVDLESATWARAAASRGLPWAILRVVSDASDEELPGFLLDCQRDDGSLHRGMVAARAIAVPTRLNGLVRLRRRVHEAAWALSGAVEAMMLDAGFGSSRDASREAM